MDKPVSGKHTVFRRIGGRIVPISVGTAGGVGAATALNALNTTRLTSKAIEKAGVTIVKKKFALQPFVWTKLGTRLNMYKGANYVGNARFFPGADGAASTFGFSWLGVRKAFRGQGQSKLLSSVAAGEIRRQGGTHVWNQVVHPGSLTTNFKATRDSLWKVGKAYKDGSAPVERIGMSQALKNIDWHRKRWTRPNGTMEALYHKVVPHAKIPSNPNVFRQTSLKGVAYKNLKEFRPLSNKLALGIGAGVAVGALAYFALRKKNGSNKHK
jgi:hypothetical protein